MTTARLGTVLSHLHMLARGSAPDLSDSQLVERYFNGHDEAAFATLVKRFGNMVWGVCRHVLSSEQDAEDAFQATFLILARKAGSIRKANALGGWLHGVAYRSAMKAKTQAARRRAHEKQAAPIARPKAENEAAWRELQAMLDEELHRLPDHYRAPFVLCCLEGNSKAEAARRLGWKEGTVSSRLARARKRLQDRLTSRGVSLSALLCGAALTHSAASGAVPTALVSGTLGIVRICASQATAGLINTEVAAIVKGVTKAMVLTKYRTATALLLGVSLLATGAGALTHRLLAAQPPAAEQGARTKPSAGAADPAKPDAENPKPRTDRYGDSLPPQAVARIGTVRWWHGNDRQGCPMVYAPDGKSLISCDQEKGIRILDTTTGRELHRLEVPGEPIHCFALAPDGKTIITGSWQSPVLRQWDVSTGKELRQMPTGAKETSVVAFSSDGKTLAAVTEQTVIRLFDVDTWKETHQLERHTGWIGSVVFSPDGKTLVSGGGNTRTVRWWDVGTGREIKRLDNKSDNYWELALSPDGKRLATLNPPGVLYLWDATTGDEISRTELGEERGWSCLCFSPNSEILACGDIDQSPSWKRDPGLGRRVNQTLFLAAATGQELRRWDEVGYTSRMAFSPNGKILAQAQDEVIRLRDATTGKPILEAPLPDRVMSVRFTPDERTLLASYLGGETGAWQPLTGEQRSPLKGPPKGFAGRAAMLLGTALSADGMRAALVDAKGVLHVWDPATGKVWCHISEPLVGEDQADFSPDGSLLVVKHVDNVIRIWDTATGKLKCSLSQPGTIRLPHPHAFSPDGRVLATTPSSQDKSVIRLWDTATGKELGKLAWQDNCSPSCLAFSPAGKYLVAAHSAWGEPAKMGRPDEIGLRLWDLATGREIRRFNTPARDIRAVVVSPDGKTLAAGANDTVLLWELATGKDRGRFQGHQARVWSLAFSPSGRLLASGSLDHTALVWDVTGMRQDGKLLTPTSRPDEIERLWTGLGSEDGIRAYRAMWMMVAAARPSVSFLAEHLRPEAPVEDGQLKRLIDELDSEQFMIRTRASQELEELGELAETALRKALAGDLSLEARRRVENLLHKVEARILSPKQLLTLRAIEVLEHIDTPEARQLLRRQAGGAAEARLTREAKAALERLAKRSSTKP